MLIAIPYALSHGAMQPQTKAVTATLKGYGLQVSRTRYVHCRNRVTYALLDFVDVGAEAHFMLSFREFIATTAPEKCAKWWEQIELFKCLTDHFFIPYEFLIDLHKNHTLHPWEFDKRQYEFVQFQAQPFEQMPWGRP